MASRIHDPFWTEDTLAAAVLAGVGTAAFQSKLDAIATRFDYPALHAFALWWPLLLIIGGLVLLLLHPARRSEDPAAVKRRSREFPRSEVSRESHS